MQCFRGIDVWVCRAISQRFSFSFPPPRLTYRIAYWMRPHQKVTVSASWDKQPGRDLKMTHLNEVNPNVSWDWPVTKHIQYCCRERRFKMLTNYSVSKMCCRKFSLGHFLFSFKEYLLVKLIVCWVFKQEVKVIWQKAPHGGPIPRLGVTPGGRNLYHWIPGVGVPISVP